MKRHINHERAASTSNYCEHQEGCSNALQTNNDYAIRLRSNRARTVVTSLGFEHKLPVGAQHEPVHHDDCSRCQVVDQEFVRFPSKDTDPTKEANTVVSNMIRLRTNQQCEKDCLDPRVLRVGTFLARIDTVVALQLGRVGARNDAD